MEIDIKDLISIGSICITFLSGIIGLIVNSLIQRKSNSIKIITENRLKRRSDTQRIVKELLAYSDLAYIQMLKEKREVNKSENIDEINLVIKKIVEDVAELRALFSFCFDKDVELVLAAYKLKNLLISDILQDESEYELKEARLEFSQIADIYLSTEWKRIKTETVGKEKKGSKSLPSWEASYEMYKEGYDERAAEGLFMD